MLGEWIQMNILYNPKVLDNMEYIIDNIIYSVIAIIVILILRWLTMRRVRKKHSDHIKLFAEKRLMNSAYIGALIILLLAIWYESSTYIIAVVGVLTAGIAIALRDILVDMIGWAYILWATPFKIGDRIEIGGQIGDVIDVTLLHFSILEVGKRISGEQSTGRIIQIPNLQVFNMPLANYEKGFKFIWNELVVPIDRESDWEKAKEKIYEILDVYMSETIEEAKVEFQEIEKNTAIYFNNLTPIIYTELKGNQIALNVRYLCEPRQLRVTEHYIWEAILKMVKENEEIRLG